jgi:hypothetical protein
MTKEAVLYQFWNSFGLPAYEESSVPDNPPQQYITYECATSNWGEQVALSANIWYKNTQSWTGINEKAREIAAFLGYGGINILCDNGSVTLRQGTPFARNGEDDNGNTKQKYINITAEYNTEL